MMHREDRDVSQAIPTCVHTSRQRAAVVMLEAENNIVTLYEWTSVGINEAIEMQSNAGKKLDELVDEL